MSKEFFEALDEIAEEKGITTEMVEEAISAALLSAYKRSYNTDQNVRVEMDRENESVKVYLRRDVVEEVENEDTEISIEDALEIDPDYEVGDFIDFEMDPADFGRIAAQSARQVTQQRFKEAERNMIYEDYSDKVGEVLTGKVQRIQRGTIYVNIGRAEGILKEKEQVPGEHFSANDHIKVYITDVQKTTKGPQVFLSRSHPGLVKKLFEMEVPEIEEGLVEIVSIAREAGSRSKIAVYTEDENIDPVGACVGSRGGRVQAVVDELFNEKIDIITWSEDPVELIKNVLSPAVVEQVIIGDEEKMATVVVPDHQLSLAIGKSGQNVRLAAKLCNWKIDIKSHTQFEEEYEIVEEYIEDEDVAVEEITDEEMTDEAAAEEETVTEELEEIEEVEETEAAKETEAAEATDDTEESDEE